MTDTTNGLRALPWRSDGYRILDADGIEVANTRTRDLASKTVAKDIAADVNACYSSKERVIELERQLSEASRNAKWMADANQRFEVHIWEEQKRAEEAEKRAEQAEIDRSELLKYYERYQEAAKRAEAAEADLSYYKTASKNFEDFYWEADKRAEEAEARVRELEEKLERPTWKYGVLDYDRRMDLAKAGAGSAAFLDDEYDDYPVRTFTAPDGRVFREGQRVQGVHSGRHGTLERLLRLNGVNVAEVSRDGEHEEVIYTKLVNLRRVWGGSEEPDVPVGTVLRDSYGCYLERLSGTRWELRDDKGDTIDNDEWVNLDGEQFRPYVEVLEGDE